MVTGTGGGSSARQPRRLRAAPSVAPAVFSRTLPITCQSDPSPKAAVMSAPGTRSSVLSPEVPTGIVTRHNTRKATRNAALSTPAVAVA
jgi:hypothetical protein